HARLETSNGMQPHDLLNRAARVLMQPVASRHDGVLHQDRYPEIGFFCHAFAAKTRLRHADDGESSIPQPHRRSQHTDVASEAALPVVVAYHHVGVLPHATGVGLSEQPSDGRVNSKYRKIVLGDEPATSFFLGASIDALRPATKPGLRGAESGKLGR